MLGPSGCGKTTLLNMIGALDSPTEGRVVVAGSDITRASRKELFAFRRHGVSFVFQTFNLFPALTALENAEFGADVAGRDEPGRGRGGDARTGGPGDRLGGTSRTSSPAASSSGSRSLARWRRGNPIAAGRRADRRAGLPHGRADPRAAARPGPHRPRGRRGDAQPRDRARRRSRDRALERARGPRSAVRRAARSRSPTCGGERCVAGAAHGCGSGGRSATRAATGCRCSRSGCSSRSASGCTPR